ncbi:zinc-ribbon domain-containing protein [Candidatus Thiodictyon syntrophicum]|jgi:hypothetical protein|uniref:zinc-ribbon domain-containing protein n=1 Tax=Candidatus Thiodictyon syntrophicum TaxID=1166950 RepID=UPI0012FE3A44|nr:zinc-ribbon domain-containing protein [Candidatus Thiodictyon syntrophicum]
MAMKKCKECGEQISSKAEKCPKCGHPNEAQSSLSAVVGLIVFGGLLWFFFGGGLEKQAAKDLKQIESQVAWDQVTQYNIAKRQGDPIQICVQAGMVSAAYLQANDSFNYNQWKATEKSDCRAAGMPQ